MNQTIKDLALQYAECLIKYHEISYHCEGSDMPEDLELLQDRYDEMMRARAELSEVTRTFAKRNYFLG